MGNKKNKYISDSYKRPTREQVATALAPFRVDCSSDLSAKITDYMELLLQWNKKINLTAILEPKQILVQHFGESFFAASVLEIGEGRLADAGSGVGFPGLALKLMRPNLTVTLIEANAKKAAFLSEVIRRLGVEGVNVLRMRLDEAGLSAASLDFVTARAVGHFDELLGWSKRALKPTGMMILWLGQGTLRQLKERPDWQWQEPIPIPLSARRYILVGRPLF